MILPRFYPILDDGLLAERQISLPEAATAVLEGGARILQWRFKRPPTRSMLHGAEQAAEMCRRAAAQFIVNDRADLAAMLGVGLHLGQDDLPPEYARRILGSEPAVGLSTHNEEQLTAALGEPVDYFALGPIFGTRSKQNPDPMVGLRQLHEWRRLTHRPLVAIGGVTRENALAVLDAGADSLAVIGDAIPEICSSSSLRQRVREWVSLLGG